LRYFEVCGEWTILGSVENLSKSASKAEKKQIGKIIRLFNSNKWRLHISETPQSQKRCYLRQVTIDSFINKFLQWFNCLTAKLEKLKACFLEI
jgi:hypothetical protein